MEDKDGNLKAPSEALECGDKVIADTDYGTDSTAGFKFRGDLDNSDSFTVSDIKKLCDSIIDGTPDLTLGDVDNNSHVNVTDIICLEGIMAGLHKGVKDTSDSPAISTKLGVLTDGEYEVLLIPTPLLTKNSEASVQTVSPTFFLLKVWLLTAVITEFTTNLPRNVWRL